MLNKVKKIINIVALMILIPILIIAVVLIIKSYIDKVNPPSIFGYSPLIVLTGSMESEIYTGDLVIIKKVNVNELKEGDIIAFFTDNKKQTIVTHRIIEISGEGESLEFKTKGDNNNIEDSGTVDADLVVGKYQNIRFKGLGNAAMFLQTPTGICVIISIPMFIFLIAQYFESRRNRKELEELRKNK